MYGGYIPGAMFQEDSLLHYSSWMLKAGLFILTISLGLDLVSLASPAAETQWFQRSGGILVLVGIIVEYALLTAPKQAIIFESDVRSKHFEELRKLPLRETKFFRKRRKYAHISVVVGTFVWAYADLIV